MRRRNLIPQSLDCELSTLTTTVDHGFSPCSPFLCLGTKNVGARENCKFYLRYQFFSFSKMDDYLNSDSTIILIKTIKRKFSKFVKNPKQWLSLSLLFLKFCNLFKHFSGLPSFLAFVVKIQSQTRMRGFIVKSAQGITALTTAKTAMKAQSTNTKDTEFFHLAQGKLVQIYALQEEDN
jgi:hypothetical protein